MFTPELYYGNMEYKLYISLKKKERILSQFFFRMREGNGKSIYIIGITDTGFLFIQNLNLIIKSINNLLTIVKKYATYKIKVFTKKSYVYAIVTFLNYNFEKNVLLNHL
jgi:GTPase